MAAWHDDDDRILCDNALVKRQLRRQDEPRQHAYEAGLEGFEWQPELHWPTAAWDRLVFESYLSGRCWRRRLRWGTWLDRLAAGLAWLARLIVPKTTSLVARARERYQERYQ
jgi:hypothetical protein